MKQQVFISHYSKDKEIADIIARHIEELTDGNIHFWYSSDSNPESGMRAGDIIFNEIVTRLNESVATIVLLTPRSIDRPWILFESGIAQGRVNQFVIPVCVGLNKDEIRQPLSNYYCYQLSDVFSLTEFVSKMLGRLKVDKKINELALQPFLLDLQETSRTLFNNKGQVNDIANNLVNEMKVHLDKKFLSLAKKLDSHELSHNLSYTIPIYIGIGKFKDTIDYIEIRNNDNVQTILDKIYFLLDREVEPYTYLKSWVLKERHCGAYMIMREITNLVPASFVFQSGFEWEVVVWDNNYNPSDSKFKMGLYPCW